MKKALFLGLLTAGVVIISSGRVVHADSHTGQSKDIAIIGGTTLNTNALCSGSGLAANNMAATSGGCLPVSGPAGELGDFTFTPMSPGAVNAANLDLFDTAVLNVASYAIHCNTGIFSAQQKADLVNFVASGHKLIIYDSECPTQDYSWLPFPFTTANPGARGAHGTLTVVEDNLLSTRVGDPSCSSGDPHCINVNYLGTGTDAVGDMNVMTTMDPNWCVDMAGTNDLNVNGAVHTYAKFPLATDSGLIIYNGLDQDYQYQGEANLRKIWVQELQQPFNPSLLPCGIPVVGIALAPPTASNPLGQPHTVTATLTDLLNRPQTGIAVTFSIVSGPNNGAVGTCSADSTCLSDANGQISFTYTGSNGIGTDEITACFNNQAGQQICSQKVTKQWVNNPPVALCKNVAVSADSSCHATVSIDNGSYDPDGDPITVNQTPATFNLGATLADLLVTDSHGAAALCSGEVTVADKTPPKIVCPEPIKLECTGKSGASAAFSPKVADNCGVNFSCVPPSGSMFPLGTTAVPCTAGDNSGNTASCKFSVSVVDTSSPTVVCTPSFNPSEANIPTAGSNPASGKNPDGFYKVSAADRCTVAPKITIGGFTLTEGETIKITQSPGASGVNLVNTMGPLAVKHFQVGPRDAVVIATDESGNTAEVSCLVPPPPK